MKYDIFVSYRRTDRELVASIIRRLEGRGVAVDEVLGVADHGTSIEDVLDLRKMLGLTKLGDVIGCVASSFQLGHQLMGLAFGI